MAKGKTEFATAAKKEIDKKASTPAPKAEKKVEYYRFNLKMPMEYEEYLKAAAYKASNASHTVTITEYINMLIEKDMKANGAAEQ